MDLKSTFSPPPNVKYVPSYYDRLGMGHDYIVRCTECKSLVLTAGLGKNGCLCGNRRFSEIQQLTVWELFKIRLLFDFPYKGEFLSEFTVTPVNVFEQFIVWLRLV